MKRIYHPYWDWECYKAGFFNTTSDLEKEEAQKKYCEFLGDLDRFEKALQRVISEWTISCEQFLSNDSMNRIAWLGQASMCIETGIPSIYRGGFRLLSEEKQKQADEMALKYLNIFLNKYEEKNKQIYFKW